VPQKDRRYLRYLAALYHDGQKTGIHQRLKEQEKKLFDERVFEQSCRSCHATCGSCHVKARPVGKIGIGLIDHHRFVKRKEGKTCAFCHGGRVYTEFTGEYGEAPDVHYQKGMLCMDCHKKQELHGDGRSYPSMRKASGRPSCTGCHQVGKEARLTTRIAHREHQGKVSCYGCHVASDYRNCQGCHLVGGASSQPGKYLGNNPRQPGILTTLRLVPTVRDTFKQAGIAMENYDQLPNYWDSAVHNIRKKTDRTQSCDVCHVDRQDFLTADKLLKDGSRANKNLLFKIRTLDR